MKMSTNTNPETGIRYTVFALNNINPDVAQELFYGPQAHDESHRRAMKELEEEARKDAGYRVEDGALESEDVEDWVEAQVERCSEDLQIEEPLIEGTLEGVEYQITWLGGAPLLWVFESPHKSTFRLCSPCVPNACDGDSPDENGHEGYDIPEDWKEQAP
jgi:hypothetical protein